MKKLIFLVMLLCFVGSSYAVAVGLSYNSNLQCFDVDEEKMMQITLSGVNDLSYNVEFSEDNLIVTDHYEREEQTKVEILVDNNVVGNYTANATLCVNPAEEGLIRNCVQAKLTYEIKDACVVEPQVEKENSFAMFIACLIIFILVSSELIRK